jgi:hypothetical protein
MLARLLHMTSTQHFCLDLRIRGSALLALCSLLSCDLHSTFHRFFRFPFFDVHAADLRKTHAPLANDLEVNRSKANTCLQPTASGCPMLQDRM